LSKLVGTSGTGSTTLSSLNTEFGLAGLADKKLITFGDMRLPKNSANFTSTVERLLAMTGGDELPVRSMRTDPISRKVLGKCVAASNIKLHLPDESGTIATRFHTFDFVVSFAESVREGLDDEIWAEESSGILAWAVKGFNDFVAAGSRFPMNAATADMVESMERAADTIIQFKQDCLMMAPAGSEGACFNSVRKAYRQYLADKCPSEKPPSQEDMTRSLKSNGIHVIRPQSVANVANRPYRLQGWAINATGLEYLRLADCGVADAQMKRDVIEAQLDRLKR